MTEDASISFFLAQVFDDDKNALKIYPMSVQHTPDVQFL